MVTIVAGICAFPILLKSPLQNAHADGLSFESLPPSMIAGRPISLFIKIDPQILNPESAGNTSLQLRLFDSLTMKQSSTLPTVFMSSKIIRI